MHACCCSIAVQTALPLDTPKHSSKLTPPPHPPPLPAFPAQVREVYERITQKEVVPV